MGNQVECYKCNKWFSIEEFKNGVCPNCGAKSPHFFEEKEEGTCPVCHYFMGPDDKFCQYCGAPANAEFQPYWNIMETVYGPPPIEVELTCKNCGYHWVSYEDAFNGGTHFCPKCGKRCGE